MQIERHTLVAVATRNYNTQLIKKNQTKNNNHIYHSIALIISGSFSIQQKQDNGTNNG